MTALLWITAFLASFLGLSFALLPGGADPAVLLGGAFLGLALVVGFYLWRGEHRLLARLARGGVVILPILLVALIPIIAIFAVAGFDIRLWQAVMAGLVVVLGWLSTFMFQEERLAQDRREQEIDLLLALRAEVLNFIWKFEQEDFDKILTNFEDLKDDSTKPLPQRLIPSQAEPIVFRSVAGNLPLIDDVALSLTVQFYAQLEDIGQLASDLGSDQFRALTDRDYKLNLLIKYVEMQRLAIRLGLIAVRRIEQTVPEHRWKEVVAYASDTDEADPAPAAAPGRANETAEAAK